MSEHTCEVCHRTTATHWLDGLAGTILVCQDCQAKFKTYEVAVDPESKTLVQSLLAPVRD